MFPTREDLELLVHVREVDVNDTELVGGDDDGWLAVVLANRLPVMDLAADKPVRYMACLVNLEGQLGSLPPEQPDDDFFVFERVQDWRVLLRPEAQHRPRSSPAPGCCSDLAVPGAARRGARRRRSREISEVGPDPASAHRRRGRVQGVIEGDAVGDRGRRGQRSAALQPEAQRLVRDAMSKGWHVPISPDRPREGLPFPVLAYWSFTTTDGADFEYLMQNLDYGLLGTLEGEHLPRDPELRRSPRPWGQPTPPPDRPTAKVLETGHVQLDAPHAARGPTQAWYRGPLVPHPTKRDQPVDGCCRSRTAPTSCAGRSRTAATTSATRPRSRSAACSRCRSSPSSRRCCASAASSSAASGYARSWTPSSPSTELLVNVDASLGRLVSHTLIEALGTKTVTTIGPTRPVVDPGRPVRVSGDLDQIVAAGWAWTSDPCSKGAAKVGHGGRCRGHCGAGRRPRR